METSDEELDEERVFTFVLAPKEPVRRRPSSIWPGDDPDLMDEYWGEDS